MNDRDELHLLTGAYALNALDGIEKDRFEAYLLVSEEARAEVASLSDTAVAIALAAAPVTPPVDLRARLMAQIAVTPQLATSKNAQPNLKAVSSADSSPTIRASAKQTIETHTADDADELIAKAAGSALPLSRAEAKAAARWFRHPAALLIGAVAALALFFGGTVLGNSFGSRPDSSQAASVSSIIASGDSQVVKANVSGGGKATFVWSASLQKSAVLIDKLPALSTGKTYELWYIDLKSNATPAGTFNASSTGRTVRILDGKMSAGDTLGVTVEPTGGSKKPTTAPIVAVPSA